MAILSVNALPCFASTTPGSPEGPADSLNMRLTFPPTFELLPHLSDHRDGKALLSAYRSGYGHVVSMSRAKGHTCHPQPRSRRNGVAGSRSTMSPQPVASRRPPCRGHCPAPGDRKSVVQGTSV